LAKLKFFAKDDDLVYVPDFPRVKGAIPQYVGRKFVPADGTNGASFPASAEPFECDSEDENGKALVNKFQRGKRGLWPADEATAKACGVSFAAVEVKDGIAVAKTTTISAATSTPTRSRARDEG